MWLPPSLFGLERQYADGTLCDKRGHFESCMCHLSRNCPRDCIQSAGFVATSSARKRSATHKTSEIVPVPQQETLAPLPSPKSFTALNE
eukprot:2923139-Amphidinium_carterae.1